MNTTATPRKQNKAGKITSHVIIGGCLIILAFFVLRQVYWAWTGRIEGIHKSEMVTETRIPSGVFQPVSPKLSSPDTGLISSMESKVTATAYAEVWKRLSSMDSTSTTEDARTEYARNFLAPMGLTFDEYGGVILSTYTGEPVSASTTICYLNGYIPEKPYLKVNCPSS
jgi:hypothetical protein